MDKFLNDMQDASEKISIGISEKGKLQRLYFPKRDYFEFIDNFDIAFKVNNSQMIFLSDDINNIYKTRYLDNSNIIEIITTNTYFNISFKQTIFVSNVKDLVVIDIDIINLSDNSYDIKLYVASKIHTSKNNIGASKIFSNGIEQFNHDYILAIYSNKEIFSHRLNDIEQNLKNCNIYDKDICGMSNYVCICYDLGIIKKEQKQNIPIFLAPMEKKSQKDFEKYILKAKKDLSKELFEKRLEFDKCYLEKHDKLKINFEKYEKQLRKKLKDEKEIQDKIEYKKRIYNIYVRTLFLLKNLCDPKTGAIIAAMEVDENRQKSGMYNFVWPRDSVFVTQALDLMGLIDITDNFYLNFIKNAQNKDGSFEQRYFCDGTMAPSWGYQIDETASIIVGIYTHYKKTKNKEFLKNTFEIATKAYEYLKIYIDDSYDVLKQNKSRKLPLSYDLWEMHEGYSLYSFASILAGLNCFEKQLNILKKDKIITSSKSYDKEFLKQLKEYKNKVQEIIKLFEIDNCYVRNLEDKNIDISILSLVYPFEIIDANDKLILNTIQKMDMELRTYTNGYKRFVGDSYLDRIPWPICNLFLANYYIKSGNYDKALELFNFVVYSCSKNFMLGEQIDNSTMKPIWVIGLGWSHAMFVLTLFELINLGLIDK